MPGMAEVKRWSGGQNEAQEQAEVKGDDKKTLGWGTDVVEIRDRV